MDLIWRKRVVEELLGEKTMDLAGKRESNLYTYLEGLG